MLLGLRIILPALFWGSSFAQSDSEEEILATLQKCDGGYCMPEYQCSRNDTVIKDGEGIMQPRLSDDDDDEIIYISTNRSRDGCKFLEKCCRVDDMVQPSTTSSEGIVEEPLLTCGNASPNATRHQMDSPSVAQFGEFPWMVALLDSIDLLGEPKQEYFCGGSLIHPRAVLTAAHCVKNRNSQKMTARLGEWETSTENEWAKHENYAVQEVIIHESYHESKFFNDIALVMLEKPVQMKVHIRHICLPEPNESFDGVNCISNGWGKADFHRKDRYAEILKKITLPIIERSACVKMLRKTRLGPFFRLHSTFICAGGQAGIDVCEGDGGSPLSCARPDGTFVQVGIVAWGVGCGEENVPGVYVNVANYVEWINQHLNEDDNLLDKF